MKRSGHIGEIALQPYGEAGPHLQLGAKIGFAHMASLEAACYADLLQRD